MVSRVPTTGNHGRNVSISLNPAFSKTFMQPSFSNSLSSMTRNVLRKKTSKIVTYSKKCPIQIVNKDHFDTPEAPGDIAADGSDKGNVSGSSQVLSAVLQKGLPRKKLQKLEGGSYSSFIQEKAGWLEGSGHAVSATRSIMRGGSSLALRNISNIPIEKTLSTTPCRESHINHSTPGRRRSETPKALTPHSTGRQKKQRLVQMGRSKHLARQRRVKDIVPIAALVCKSNNATCHSVEAMSTCTIMEVSSDAVYRCPTAQSVKSMSLCSSAEATKEGKTMKGKQYDCSVLVGTTQQPANSTFGDGSHLDFRDTVPRDLSAIGEPCQTDDKEEGDDDTLTPDNTDVPPATKPASQSNSSHHQMIRELITPASEDRTKDSKQELTNEKETLILVIRYDLISSVTISRVPCELVSSTPTDPGKVPPVMLDISEIECDQRETVETKQDVNTEILLGFDPLPLEVSSTVDTHTMANPVAQDSRKDITPESEHKKGVPREITSSTPTDPGKVPPVMLDISEIECDQRETVETKQDVNTEILLEFDPLPLEVSSTVDTHTMVNPVAEDSRKDITPESEQQKYSATATPRHKRQLAYLASSSEPEELTSCCLLADWPCKKRKSANKSKQLAPWNEGEHESLPTDVLCLL